MDITTVIRRLDRFDEDHTIYTAAPPDEVSASTGAVVLPDDGRAPAGWFYFLEVDLAMEAVEVWSTWRDDRTPTLEEKLEAVTHYAANDAYLPALDL